MKQPVLVNVRPDARSAPGAPGEPDVLGTLGAPGQPLGDSKAPPDQKKAAPGGYRGVETIFKPNPVPPGPAECA